MCRSDGTLLVASFIASVILGCQTSHGDETGLAGDGTARTDGGASTNPDASSQGDGHVVPSHPKGDAGASSPSACTPALALCDAPGATCCAGTVCVGDTEKRCVETCTTRFDCGSLCCETDAAGRGLCVDADRCPPIPCSDIGGKCDGPGFSCCDGLACVSSTSPDYGGCRKPCAAQKDCDTGCCVPYADGELGFCAAASACACADKGAACGGTKHCCDGLTCASGSTPGVFACTPTCTTNTDCASNCCVAIPGTSESGCFPANYCPP